MKHLLRLLGSFLIAILILSTISSVMEQFQILDPSEQARLKEGKTFWNWVLPDGKTSAIHYIEKGHGSKNVILLHGFRANTYTWRHLLDSLAEGGFHVWALDLIGFGFSDKPDVPYDFELFKRQIVDFMRDNKIDKAHFVGSSMGGGISLGMAAYHSEKVESLTLLCALGYPFDLPLYISIGKHLKILWAPFVGPSVIRNGLEELVYSKAMIDDELVQAYFLPYRFPGGASSAVSTLKNFDNQKLIDLTKYYKGIGCPVLVIWGEHDKLIPRSHFDYFCRDFPHAKKLLLEKCGHIPHEEKPHEVRAAILDFLTESVDISQ